MATEHTNRADIQRLLASGASDAAVCDAFFRLGTNWYGPAQAAHRFAVACFICANRSHLAERVFRGPIALLHSECRIDDVEWFSRAGEEIEAEWGAEAGLSGLKWAREELPKLRPLLEWLLWESAAWRHLNWQEEGCEPPMTEEWWLATEKPNELRQFFWQRRPFSNREWTASAAAVIRAAERRFPSPDAFRYVTDIFEAKLLTGVDRPSGNRPNNLPESLRAIRADLSADECRAVADGIRDVFGNPFRPVEFAPEWRTSDVLLLARGIHTEGAFDRMPILADALQDAGCDNDEVLNHCRGGGPHVRGCWVIDHLLGLA